MTRTLDPFRQRSCILHLRSFQVSVFYIMFGILIMRCAAVGKCILWNPMMHRSIVKVFQQLSSRTRFKRHLELDFVPLSI